MREFTDPPKQAVISLWRLACSPTFICVIGMLWWFEYFTIPALPDWFPTAIIGGVVVLTLGYVWRKRPKPEIRTIVQEKVVYRDRPVEERPAEKKEPSLNQRYKNAKKKIQSLEFLDPDEKAETERRFKDRLLDEVDDQL